MYHRATAIGLYSKDMTVLGYAEVYMSILLLTHYLQHHTSQSNSLWALKQIGVCTQVFVSQVKTVTILLLLQIYIYMGSSSVVVLIGSHSLCNSFVVNQFLFYTPNG